MDENEFKGLLGESLTVRLLNEKIDVYKKIIHDITLEYSGDTQIDNILITSKGIYVIENKNWNGIISVDKNERWYQTLKKKQLTDRNPVKQNECNIKALMNFLKKDKALFKSIIVLGYNAKKDLNTKYDDHIIVNIQDLTSTVLSDMRDTEADLLSHEEIDNIYLKLKLHKEDNEIELINN